MSLRSSTLPLVLSAVLLSCCCLTAKADSCSAVPGNFINNCGFENGIYSSTIMGQTNSRVPVGWTPNYGFDLEPGDNLVAPYPQSGTYGLSIGNSENEAVPMLSQSFADLAGGLYSGSIYVANGPGNNGDLGAFFEVQIDGTNVVLLNSTASPAYTQYFFGFTGTGNDTFSFGGNLTHSEWYADNITVTGPAAGATPPVTAVTPEPSSLMLLGTGLLAVAGAARRRLA